ncbi:hypothetical protein EUGRSUZ_I00856 [Eucalyptus grandis]|uniref:Uncharacterized protein n=2 Tax=Eucalyptus grandis TaxID=71139 RepID=A0A059ANB8_EUCGR|nr:hypothetical protein EUGRSUZ_I00856 [Eucalyptus grandis]
MAAIRCKELLGWYVITLKLRETMESRLPKKSTYESKIVPDYEPRPSNSEWVISIEKKLAQGRQENMPGSWAKLSIYRIPRYLKNGKDKAWVPQIVSLGPYHHGDKHLRHMEQHKWRCLHRILKSSGKGIALYLDSIQRDMLMLENQIPLFILDRLLGLQLGNSNQKECVAELALQFFKTLIKHPRGDSHFIWEMPKCYPFDNEHYSERLEFNPFHEHGKVHCLEVFRRSLLHLGLEWPTTKYWSQRLERPMTKYWSQGETRLTFYLSKLREAGIQIRLRHPARSWGDIEFKNGILGIPFIEINEGMRSLFLNLIAFEQSHFNCSHYVTSYVIFMHSLINSPEDVLHLRDCGIIKHCLGSDAEVANLFHRLCQEVALNPIDSYLFRPWSIVSLIAAFVLLLLTCIQTFYAVYTYYRPRS